MAARTSKRLSKIEKIGHVEKRLATEERKIEKEEKKIEKVEKEILFEIGSFKLRKKHVFDVAKIAGGALLGTGLGLDLMSNYEEIATQLPWFKVIGLFVTSMFIAALMIYHEDHAEIRKVKHKALFLAKRLLTIYLISITVVSLVTIFFSPELIPLELIIKVLFIGSFSAVSGAVTFDML